MKVFLYIVLFSLIILTSVLFTLTAPLTAGELQQGMVLTSTEESIHQLTIYLFVLLSIPTILIGYSIQEEINKY
jgi:hypothetical protein